MNVYRNDNKRKTYSIQLLTALAREGKFIFSTKEARQLSDNTDIPKQYVSSLLMNMVRNGLIKRLRKGIYTRTEVTSGNMQVHPFSIATHIITPSAISHWSALHYHGFTEQIPRIINAFTTKKVVTPGMRGNNVPTDGRHAWIIDDIRYEYITVKKDHFFGIEKIWIDEFSRIPITDKERTILALFISPRMFGGMGETIGIFKHHIDSLLLQKLVKYACQYGKISVARRLGWTLDKIGVSEAIYAPLLNMHATGYHLLDPTRPNKGKCDSRWMIQNNLVGGI
jgi:predicted transcriptional regulator of viral defense system